MWSESLALSKSDRLWRDALETSAASRDISVAEELASYFVQIGNKDAFAALLFVCFELIRPDFVEEMVSGQPMVFLMSGLALRSCRLHQALQPASSTGSIRQGGYSFSRRRILISQLAALEAEVKALRASATKTQEAEEAAPSLGAGFGGRLMLTGVPT